MEVNMRSEILKKLPSLDADTVLRIPNIIVVPEDIWAVMINEVVPADPQDDFYGGRITPDYCTTLIPLMQKAGIQASSTIELLDMGIYITNAVKRPKSSNLVSKDELLESLPVLREELGLFPNLKSIMLNGDVAIKAFNTISKQQNGARVIPPMATYKIRGQEFFSQGKRVFPSYIVTGKNLQIERSKLDMVVEDVQRMMEYHYSTSG